MQNYIIYTNQQPIRVSQSGGIITAATVGFLIGLPFDLVRDHAIARGFKIVPELDEENRPFQVEFKAVTYRFYWRGSDISRITQQVAGEDEQDITWHELPNQVKGLL